MKKLLILAVAFGTFAFASCKKEYTCVCTPTGGGAATEYKSGVKLKKADAKTWCNLYAAGGLVTCSLK